MLELDETSGIAAQVALLTSQFSTFLKTQQGQQVITCGICQDSHHTDHCPQLADVNMVRNFQRNQNQPWSSQQGQQQPVQNWNLNQGGNSWNQQAPTRMGGNKAIKQIGRVHINSSLNLIHGTSSRGIEAGSNINLNLERTINLISKRYHLQCLS